MGIYITNIYLAENQQFGWFISILINFKENPTPFIGIIAVFLAWLAFYFQIFRKYNIIKDILISLREEIKFYEPWLKDGHAKESFDKGWFDPCKFVYKIDAPTVREIISKGHLSSIKLTCPFGCDIEELIKHLTRFNERVVAFNEAIDNIILNCSANPVLTQEVKDIFDKCNAKYEGQDVSREDFRKCLEQEYKNYKLTFDKSQECNRLFERIYWLNWELHVDLIASYEREDKLNHLWNKINDRIKNINRKSKLYPFYLHWYISILGPLAVVIVLLAIIYL